MIKIICDSMSDLSKEIIEKFDIHIVPCSVNIDGIEYLDGVEITNEEFYKAMRKAKEIPKTSQATYARFKEAFEKYSKEYDELVYIGGSSKASGTYQSALMAINDMDTTNIYHIDTLNFSAGSSIFVVKAGLLLNEGKSGKEIIDELEKLKGTQKVFLTVDDLTYLKKGGRLSTTKATIGSILNIKPLIELEDGITVSKGQARGKKQISSEMFKRATEGIEDFSDKIIVYGCGDNEEDLYLLKNKILQTNCKHVYEVRTGPCITAHTGPSILGMAIF